MNLELLEIFRKFREFISGEENKIDLLFVFLSRDDVIFVRDESMDVEFIIFKLVFEKDKREKDKLKVKGDKIKRKNDGFVVFKKENVVKFVKGFLEKLDGEREKFFRFEFSFKKVKEEILKIDNVRLLFFF